MRRLEDDVKQEHFSKMTSPSGMGSYEFMHNT
jgi:hypothetical protein